MFPHIGRLDGVKKADGVPVIPVLGDSFSFGLGVKDEETFINLMCKNSDAVYLNLGAPGSSIPNQLDILEFRHKELGSPGLYVFVFYLGNDFSDMIRYYEDSSNEESKNSGVMDFIKDGSFIQRSYVAQFLLHYVSEESGSRTKHKSHYFQTPDGHRISSSIYLLMSHSKPYSIEAEKDLNRSLDRLKSLSKNLHFSPEFIVIPDKHQTDLDLFNKQASVFSLSTDTLDRSYPDRFLEKHLEQRKIPYLDVMACLKDHPGMYYKNDDHLTAAGHRVVADCIHRNAERLTLLELQIADKK
ncbi:SGNH/GDSL hydrolase family protein [bacterium]|nr:SGNH/GDSL hydrolase family protein [bacterium]